MKILIFLTIVYISAFGNCHDFENAQISEKDMKKHYKEEDTSLNNELNNILNVLKEHTKKDENDYLISFDNKSLNIESLVNLKEILQISSKINKQITLQE